MQVGDLDDFHVPEGHALEYAGHVLLVTADAIKRLCQPPFLNRPRNASANRAWMPGRMREAPDTARSW